MANTATFTPLPANTINAQVGVPFNQTFSWTFTSDVDPDAVPYDLGIVSQVVSPVYLGGGSAVFFGVNVVAPTGNPSTDNFIAINGTPTVAGTYYVYVQGRWTSPNLIVNPIRPVTPQVYTVIVTGPPLTVNPAANSTPTLVTPNASVGNAYVSDQFTIQNGGGPYTVTLSGAPPTIGLSSTSSFPGSVQTTLVTSGTGFYLVGTPTAATAGTTITIQVQDQGTNHTYAGQYYKLVVLNTAGGSMTITEVSRVGYPTNTGNCVQTRPFVLTYDAGNSGTTPYSWSIGGGSLPNGLSISTVNNQGVISGTPTGPSSVGSFSFNVIVNDSASHSATLPVTLTVVIGANYSGGPLSATGSINVPYGPTTLTAVGGAGGANKWYVKRRNPNLTEAPGLFNTMTMTPGPSFPESGYDVVLSNTVQIGGTPNAAVPVGSAIVVKPAVDDGHGGFIFGDDIVFPLTISGTNALHITPASLGTWIQNQAHVETINVIDGISPYTWSAVTGLPSGITSSFTTSASGTLTGGYTGYGSFSISLSVTDNASNTGAANYTLTVQPDIWTNDVLASGVRGHTYSQSLTFHGGDNTGFSYVVNTATLPAGIVATPTGAGNSVLSFTSSSIGALAGTYNVAVRITVPTVNVGGTFTKDFLIPIVITGSSSITLTPFTANLCTKDGAAFSLPKVKMGAVVTGGSNNTYTITPPAGWVDQGTGPYASNQATSFVQSVHTNGVYTFTLTSTEDAGATQPVVVTVSTGSTTNPSISPTGPTQIFSGQSISFIPTMPGSCSNSHGTWSFLGGNNRGCSVSANRAGQVTLYAPSLISVPDTIVLNYQPDEDPDRFASVIVNLVPGAPSAFNITTGSPLPNGTVGTTYGPVSLVATGGTGALTYSVSWSSLPTPVVMNSAGVFSSPGNLTVSSTSTFTVTAKDASAPPLWTSKTFVLTVQDGGGLPTISSLDVTQGPVGGGTTIHVTGTGFLNTDTFVFASQQISYQVDAAVTTYVSPTSLTVTTPAWAAEKDTPVAVAISRSSALVTFKNNAFTFTSGTAGFTVGSFSPTGATIGAGNTVIDVFGTGFDSSCSIRFTASWGGGEQTLSSQLFINSTTVRGTIASSNFSPTHAGTTAQIKVVRTSDGASAISSTLFQVNATTLSVTTASLPDATRSVSYSQTLAATGGSGTGYVWSVASGSLPSGLTLDSGGNITGPAGSGATSSTFTSRVTDSLGAIADKTLTINAVGGVLTITTVSPLPDASINAVYSKAILASGGLAPLTFTVVSGNLPIGLSLATDGTLAGTPTSANAAPVTFGFTVKCQDSTLSPQIDTKAYSLTLNPALSTVTVTAVSPTSGPITGGTPVTVTGTGFVNGCTVQFGVTSATNVQFINSTSVIAVTPPASGAGVVSVSVQNPDRGQGVFSGYEYKLLSSPVITSIDKQDGPFAGGQVVTLSGSNFQGVSSIKFGLTDTNSVSATFNVADISLSTVPQTITLTTPPGVTFGDGSTAVPVNIFVTNAFGVGILPIGDTGYTFRPPPIITAVVPNTGDTSGGQTVYVIGKNFFQRGAVKPRVFIGNVEVPASSITLVEQ